MGVISIVYWVYKPIYTRGATWYTKCWDETLVCLVQGTQVVHEVKSGVWNQQWKQHPESIKVIHQWIENKKPLGHVYPFLSICIAFSMTFLDASPLPKAHRHPVNGPWSITLHDTPSPPNVVFLKSGVKQPSKRNTAISVDAVWSVQLQPWSRGVAGINLISTQLPMHPGTIATNLA